MMLHNSMIKQLLSDKVTSKRDFHVLCLQKYFLAEFLHNSIILEHF